MALNEQSMQGLQAANQGFWNAVNLGWNTIQNWRDREWQAKFWKMTYDKTLEDDLKYNSPSAQLSRMRSAGVNSNLAYSQGLGSQPFSLNGDSGNATSRGANAVAPDLMQNALIASEIRNKDADTKNKLSENELIQAQTTSQEIANTFANSLNQATLDNLKKDLEAKDADIKKTLQDIKASVKSCELTDEQMKQIRANIDKIKADTAFQEAVNKYKIPFLEKGVNPDENVKTMLAKFLMTLFLGWYKDKSSYLGKLWDKWKEGLNNFGLDVKDGFDDLINDIQSWFK